MIADGSQRGPRRSTRWHPSGSTDTRPAGPVGTQYIDRRVGRSDRMDRQEVRWIQLPSNLRSADATSGPGSGQRRIGGVAAHL